MIGGTSAPPLTPVASPLDRTASSSSSPKLIRILTAILLLIAVAFRLVQYFWRESFWSDEVGLLFSVVGKSTRSLFGEHLLYSQVAPPIFMAIQQGMARLAGVSELSQRAPVMAMNLLSLALMLVLAGRLLGSAGMILALGAICLSDKLIDQASTLKPYSGDLAITLLLTLIALPAVEKPDLRRFALIALLSSVLAWMSFAAIILFAAISLCVLLRLGWSDLRKLATYGAINLLPMASVLTFYMRVMRLEQSDSYMQTFWVDAFADWHHPLSVPGWLIGRTFDLCVYPFAPLEWLGIFIVPLIVLGLYAMRTPARRATALLLAMPLIVSILLGAAGKYPYAGNRVNLFLTPGLMIFAGAGLDWLMIQRGELVRALGWCLVAMMLTVSFARDLPPLRRPRTNGSARPIVAYLRAHRTADQPMFAVRGAEDFAWYWQQSKGGPFANAAPIDPPAGRFWLVYSGDPARLHRDIEPTLLRFNEAAHMLDTVRVDGAGAILYESK